VPQLAFDEPNGVESLGNSRKEESVEKHTTIAVDLSKTVFEIAVSDQPERVCERNTNRFFS
jgi:hypothetical protein